MSKVVNDQNVIPRRTLLKLGAAGATALALTGAEGLIVPNLAERGLLSPDGVFDAASIALADAIYIEAFPTSPLILSPFKDDLPIPPAMRPVDPTAMANDGWAKANIADSNCTPLYNQGSVKRTDGTYQTHQIPAGSMTKTPLMYRIKVQMGTHNFTTSRVLPINSLGQRINLPAGTPAAVTSTLQSDGSVVLPASTIYGFNGSNKQDDSTPSFAGSRINAEYGQPVMVRFENHLDENPLNLDRQDFGAPDASFLTHLHNGHTAPESDGNPNYSMRMLGTHGYPVKTYCDNLYLNWPAGGDSREKQSFFWFHDHRMDHTGANVYKGMVGLFPIYDPENKWDMGDERYGLRLPGVRTDNGDGSFNVAYDIPLAFYDCRLDDGTTIHQDMHDGLGEFPNAGNPKKHPEWWGKTFFKHFPNHGFVGDVFTVNGTAYPVLKVKRRKYRFRFLDASVSRIYEFKLMSSTQGPKSSASLGYTGNELQGQYRIPDGQQSMKFVQIADDGGLLPFPITRDSFELWPAKRREFIVDFTKYQDGTPTSDGDAIYLTNVMKMPDGRMWSNSSRSAPDANYKVPVLKFVIDGPEMAPDMSVMPAANQMLRELPPVPANWQSLMDNRLIFEVQRGSAGGETEWLINGVPFDPTIPSRSLKNPAGKIPLARQKLGSFNLWEIRNGGGGWVHPFHLHMEEHHTMMRNGKVVFPKADAGHPDDNSREDLVALDPSEKVIVYRGFRDFVGPYVAHCHNLAHEDHAMMFGWEITP